jgi:hypothetical protein
MRSLASGIRTQQNYEGFSFTKFDGTAIIGVSANF